MSQQGQCIHLHWTSKDTNAIQANIEGAVMQALPAQEHDAVRTRWSRASTSAPLRNSTLTILWCPPLEAKCRAVQPYTAMSISETIQLNTTRFCTAECTAASPLTQHAAWSVSCVTGNGHLSKSTLHDRNGMAFES